ncbi:hypothetical protein IV203_000089 [Nitzschia inconspicua]|uniref:Uncharacterized protein n=1 Tax=Nitzschia inconspicua TaxID=303405 RepID=A0A9K3L493_9STRA|nr:hypothetical protein IV203_000089 [Nitzschia inconspicua]
MSRPHIRCRSYPHHQSRFNPLTETFATVFSCIGSQFLTTACPELSATFLEGSRFRQAKSIDASQPSEKTPYPMSVLKPPNFISIPEVLATMHRILYIFKLFIIASWFNLSSRHGQLSSGLIQREMSDTGIGVSATTRLLTESWTTLRENSRWGVAK